MRQRRLLRTVLVERRTLTTVIVTTLRLRLVPAIRAHFVKLQRRPELLRLKDERLAERLDIAKLRLAISLAVVLALLPLGLLFVLAFPQTLLEEGCYGVCDTLQLLVALGLGSLETTCNMSPDEGH